MKQTITKNDKSLKILNELISNGYYNGYVGPEKFELLRNNFPNNYRLIGILNNNGKYDVKSDFNSPMNIAAKVSIGLVILISIFFLIKGNWLILMILVIFGLILLVGFKVKQKKEINLFINKFLEFYITRYE